MDQYGNAMPLEGLEVGVQSEYQGGLDIYTTNSEGQLTVPYSPVQENGSISLEQDFYTFAPNGNLNTPALETMLWSINWPGLQTSSASSPPGINGTGTNSLGESNGTLSIPKLP
jgi:hypothetical protein